MRKNDELDVVGCCVGSRFIVFYYFCDDIQRLFYTLQDSDIEMAKDECVKELPSLQQSDIAKRTYADVVQSQPSTSCSVKGFQVRYHIIPRSGVTV